MNVTISKLDMDGQSALENMILLPTLLEAKKNGMVARNEDKGRDAITYMESLGDKGLNPNQLDQVQNQWLAGWDERNEIHTTIEELLAHETQLKEKLKADITKLKRDSKKGKTNWTDEGFKLDTLKAKIGALFSVCEALRNVDQKEIEPKMLWTVLYKDAHSLAKSRENYFAIDSNPLLAAIKTQIKKDAFKDIALKFLQYATNIEKRILTDELRGRALIQLFY